MDDAMAYGSGAMLRLILLVLPLALDTFAISAAIGVARPARRQRLRLSLLFALFEGVMPVIGFLVGASLGHAIGAEADFIAGALLVIIGGWMLWPGVESGEVERATRFAEAHGLALVALGVSVSVDELAIGFSAGLLRVPLGAAVVLIAVLAFLAAQLGLWLGTRVGENFREGAERLAGAALMGLGIAIFGIRVL